MIKKCPHCEFEPIQDQLICPNCGAEVTENISKQIKEDQTTTSATIEEVKEDSNDNINWSNYQDVSLGSVMEHFNDANDEEGKPSTSEFSDNPILEAYLRRHRDGDEEAEKDLAAAIAEQKDEGEFSKEAPKSSFVYKEKEVVTPVPEEAAEEPSLKEILPSLQGKESKNDEAVTMEESEQASEKEEESLSQEIVPEDTKALSDSEVALDHIRAFEERETEDSKADQPTEQVKIKEEQAKVEAAIEKAPKKHNNKKWVLLTAAGILFAAGGGWLYVDAQQKAEAARQEQIQQENDFAKLTAQIEAFYLDEAHQFVQPDKTTAELKKLMDQLPAFKQQENYSEVQTLSQGLYKKMVLIDTINESFTGPIIVGDSLDKEVHIKDTNPIDTELLTEKSVFAILVNEALQLGKIELQQAQSAKDAVAEVASFYKDGKLTGDLSRKAFDGAKKQVTDLFEIPEKETLLAELEPIEKALAAKEKAAKEAQIAAEKKAAEEEAARIAYEQQQQEIANQGKRENAGTEILGPNTPSNRNNAPIIASRQSDINDVNNAGWAWAPGVYDKFVNTILERGYVVPDGFYFEPARIENGEGYYHLYATSNQSKLLKGIPQSSMPYYLVTVNVKTGYFKGNGSN